MKIWGSTIKQRLSIFVSLAIIWLWSIAWMYADNHHKTGDMFSTFLCLGTTLTYILFGIYVLIDNIRSSNIRSIISESKYNLERIVELYQYEFNDRRTRRIITSNIQEYLNEQSKINYNFDVKDITTGIEQDNQIVKLEIWADNLPRSIFIVTSNYKDLITCATI